MMTLIGLWIVAIALSVAGLLTGNHHDDLQAAITGRPATGSDFLWLIGAFLFIFAFVLTITKLVLFDQ